MIAPLLKAEDRHKAGPLGVKEMVLFSPRFKDEASAELLFNYLFRDQSDPEYTLYPDKTYIAFYQKFSRLPSSQQTQWL